MLFCIYCNKRNNYGTDCTNCKKAIYEFNSCITDTLCSNCYGECNKSTCHKCGNTATRKCDVCEIFLCKTHSLSPSGYPKYYETRRAYLICYNCNTIPTIHDKIVDIRRPIKYYQTTQIQCIKQVFTELITRYGVHDKLFIHHLVLLQAKLLHFDPELVKIE